MALLMPAFMDFRFPVKGDGVSTVATYELAKTPFAFLMHAGGSYFTQFNMVAPTAFILGVKNLTATKYPGAVVVPITSFSFLTGILTINFTRAVPAADILMTGQITF